MPSRPLPHSPEREAAASVPGRPIDAKADEVKSPHIDLSVIVPVAGDSAGLETTLRSLQALDLDGINCEIIVCNDGGGDAISAIAASYRCREVRLDRNRGSYAARNEGISAARGKSMAFLDADEGVGIDWARRGLDALRDADYVGGQIIVEPGERSSYWQRVDARFAFPVAYYLEVMRFAPTANLFVARDVFHQVGGFQENLRSGGDREFGVRCFRSGISQRFDPTIRVTHPARGLAAQISKTRRTAIGTAQLEVFFWDRHPLAVAARALSMHLARICRAACFSVICIFSRLTRGGPTDRCLAAGRALIESRYHLALATSAARLLLPCSSHPERKKTP